MEKLEHKILSVVIPYYMGKERDLIRIINSVLKIKQLAEIIIVDDGSPEFMLEKVIKSYAGDKRIWFCRKENEGTPKARNYGLNLAKGEYIAFFDQDDCIVPETIDKAICNMTNDKSQILLWSTATIMEGGQSNNYCKVKKAGIVEKEDIYSKFITTLLLKRENEWINHIGEVWGGLFDIAFVKDNDLQFRRYVRYEDDLLFLLQGLLNARRVTLIEEIGYFWKLHSDSYSHKQFYVSEYIRKSIKLYDYVYYMMKTHSVNPRICDDYTNWFYQRIPINNIYNNCILGMDLWDIAKETSCIMKEEKYIFAYERKCKTKGRYFATMYGLIKTKQYLLAAIVAKCLYNKNNKKRKEKV